MATAIKSAAMNGDSAAMALWLSRIEPPVRKHGEHVEFEFDAKATPAQNIEKVLAAIAAGELSLEAGNMIISGIEKLASARAVTEVTDKSAALIEAFKDMAGRVPV